MGHGGKNKKREKVSKQGMASGVCSWEKYEKYNAQGSKIA